MRFEFATATRIIFGPGTLKEIGSIAAEMGSRALVVTGSSPKRAQPLLDGLSGARIGQFKSTFALTDGTREGAFFMAK